MKTKHIVWVKMPNKHWDTYMYVQVLRHTISKYN